MFLKTWVLALLSASLLSGCLMTRTEYVPPPTDRGRMCVSQCAATKEDCIGHQQQQARFDKETCERKRDMDAHTCRDRAGRDPAARAECEKIHNRYCSSSASTYRCDKAYEECYVNCGGVVRKIEE